MITNRGILFSLMLGAMLVSVIPERVAGQETRPATGGWTSHRGDLYNTGRNGDGRDVEKGEIKWTFLCRTKVQASPVVADGVLYVGDHDSIFYAIDAATGKSLWSTVPRASRKRDFEPAREGDDPTRTSLEAEHNYRYSNPCIAGHLVVAATHQGIVTAFARKDGAVVWERDFGKEIYSSPKFSDGKVLFGCLDNRFYALDAKTGATAWIYKAGDWVGSTAAVLKSGKIIFPSHDKHLHIVDGKTGRGLKRYPLSDRSTGTPLVAFGCAYFCTADRRFVCVDLLDGSVRWTAPATGDNQQGVGLWKNQVMVHLQRLLYAFDAQTGKEKWRCRLEGSGALSPCVGSRSVYMADARGNAYAIDLETGKERWRVNFGETTRTHPVLDHGILYVCDDLGRVRAIE